jgi:hypothetical protein
MKNFVLALIASFSLLTIPSFAGSGSTATSPAKGISADAAPAGVRLCFKTKKGRICITVSKFQGNLEEGGEIFGRIQPGENNTLVYQARSTNWNGSFELKMDTGSGIFYKGKEIMLKAGKYRMEDGKVSFSTDAGAQGWIRDSLLY